MTDLKLFFSIMALVTGAMALYDREKAFASGTTVLGLDIAHIGFGAAAGITGLLASKYQTP